MTAMTSQPRLAYNARVVSQRFRLVRMLGEGGMGVVWEVIDETNGQRRAAKFIRDEERSEVMVRRLLKEAQAVSAIQHPNVVRVEEVAIDDDGTPVIVMEFLEGETLGARLEREGCLSIGQTCAILRRVVSALHAAHAASVVHRDLKPDNIFLTVEPDGRTDVRVLDFGIAKHANVPKDSLTVTGALLGTPLYMSPEQAGGEKDLDAKSDIWSIAVILFECFTGTTPVTGENFGQILTRLIRQDVTRLETVRPDLPPPLIRLVDGRLVPRAQRNAQLGAMEATLAHYADPEIAPPRPLGSDRSLAAAASRPESFDETVGLPASPAGPAGIVPAPAVTLRQRETGARGVRAALVMGSVVLVALLGGGGWYALRVRTRALPAHGVTTDAPSAIPLIPTAPPSAVTATAPPEPSASAAPSASASVVASAVASAKHPAPHPHGTASTHPASSASKQGGAPTRLHGGVAGDVPF